MMFLDPGWIILILLVVLLIAGLPIAFVSASPPPR